MNIVFMGTPDFAVPCLEKIVSLGYPVTGVFTQPDKPKGRGYKLLPPPVKELALRENLPVFQPASVKTDEAYETLKSCAPDLIVVVAYGKILPKRVLDLPRYGCINVHASLLPRYRGAGPIQWAILNGETETGVTTMYMGEGLDTGDMLEQVRTPIGENETADELYTRLSVLGAEALQVTLSKLEGGSLLRTPQDDSLSCYAPILDKSLCPIDFTRPASRIHDQIRGLSSWPAATTTYKGKRLKVYESCLAQGSGQPGEIIDPKKFIVACGEGAVQFVSVQYEGGKRMAADAFLRGRPAEKGEFLGE
ncbi:MAG: methionyl-tRNA formyltransferase [Candidatus Faecivivens sp.]|nr:methionyl-tRNA formyltransferase [Candidatus Faecivivens sp.]